MPLTVGAPDSEVRGRQPRDILAMLMSFVQVRKKVARQRGFRKKKRAQVQKSTLRAGLAKQPKLQGTHHLPRSSSYLDRVRCVKRRHVVIVVETLVTLCCVVCHTLHFSVETENIDAGIRPASHFMDTLNSKQHVSKLRLAKRHCAPHSLSSNAFRSALPTDLTRIHTVVIFTHEEMMLRWCPLQSLALCATSLRVRRVSFSLVALCSFMIVLDL